MNGDKRFISFYDDCNNELEEYLYFAKIESIKNIKSNDNYRAVKKVQKKKGL